jgi:hypothetical protein
MPVGYFRADGASIAGSAINPYGWGPWVFLWQTVGVGRAGITEWQSLFAQPAGFVQCVVGAIVVGVGWRRRGPDVVTRRTRTA